MKGVLGSVLGQYAKALRQDLLQVFTFQVWWLKFSSPGIFLNQTSASHG